MICEESISLEERCCKKCRRWGPLANFDSRKNPGTLTLYCHRCLDNFIRVRNKLNVKAKLLDRIMMRVVKNSIGCWLWQGGKHRQGYGMITHDGVELGEKTKLVHRISYILQIGPIPNGLVLDHLCRNPACVNPEHLEAISQRENMRRGDLDPNFSFKDYF